MTEPVKRYTVRIPVSLWRSMASRLGPGESPADFVRAAVRDAIDRRPRLPFPTEGETQ